MTKRQCEKCGNPADAPQYVGNLVFCTDCFATDDSKSTDPDEDAYLDPDGDHENQIDVRDISPKERAQLLLDFTKMFERETGNRPRLMPLKAETKEPAISGNASLDSAKGRSYLVDPTEAVRMIFEENHPGFCIYADKEDHNTEGFVVVDVDEPEQFPYDEFPDTAVGMSGSGTGEHLYYHSDGNVERAFGKGEYGGVGEVKAGNWFVVTPGSIHPSGGVYHITEERDWATLLGDEIPEELQPSHKKSMDDLDLDAVRDSETVSGSSGTGGQYENDLGMDLETIREKDDKLDALLSDLVPAGYTYPSASEADFATASKLHFWRFSERDIAGIIRSYRARGKVVDRDDYLAHTVAKAASGEQMEPEEAEYYDEDADPMGILPLERLDALPHEERVRYANKRGIEWPDVDEVRSRLNDEIREAVSQDDIRVKSAPTGAGKTHAVATEPWLAEPDLTDDQPVIHAHRTHEARDQAREMSDEAGNDAYTLKGRKELCPVARGDYDPENSHGHQPIVIDGEPVSEWIDHRCERQGIPHSVVHSWAEAAVDGGLPCSNDGSECPANGQFENIPRNDEGEPSHDVIHCTHQFLLVPSLRMHTHLFIDEKPAFGIDLTPTEVRESVNAYLEWLDGPVDNYSELVHASRTGNPPDLNNGQKHSAVPAHDRKKTFASRMDEALNGKDERVECERCDGTGLRSEEEQQQHDVTSYEETNGAQVSDKCPECNGVGTVLERRGTPGIKWYRQSPNAHALAPAFARAIWNAEETAGDRKAARVPFHPPRWDNDAHDSAAWNRVYVDVVLNDQWEVVEAESVPDFSLASSVTGLDAHPQPEDPAWQANVHPDMGTDYTLDTMERTLYRRYERGLFTVQVGEGVQPVASGEWLDQGQGDKFQAVIEQLRDQYDEDFDAAITSKKAKGFVRGAMRDAGVGDPEMMHYGEEESRNDFAGKKVGLVAGSIDPGDDTVVNLCARLDLDADPCYKTCPNCEGTGNVQDDGNDEMCNTCTGAGEVRERGRTFEGNDSDLADAVLQGVREHHVAQSAGRWARNADDPEDHATVFVVTNAAPTGFIDAQAPGATWVTSDDQKERLEYVRDNADGATAKEVADACDCSKQSAWRTLKKAAEEDILERSPGRGPHGADLYAPGDGFTPNGAADLQPEEPQTPDGEPQRNAYSITNTLTVAVDALPNCAFNSPDEERRDWEHQTTFEWYERALAPPE